MRQVRRAVRRRWRRKVEADGLTVRFGIGTPPCFALANDIRRGYNSHRQGDFYRARSCRRRPVTPVTFICRRIWYFPYIDRDMNPYTRSHPIHLEEAK